MLVVCLCLHYNTNGGTMSGPWPWPWPCGSWPWPWPWPRGSCPWLHHWCRWICQTLLTHSFSLHTHSPGRCISARWMSVGVCWQMLGAGVQSVRSAASQWLPRCTQVHRVTAETASTFWCSSVRDSTQQLCFVVLLTLCIFRDIVVLLYGAMELR